MANEIKLTQTITYENGKLKYTYATGSANIPQATQGYADATVALTTAEADHTWTVTTPGLVLLRSLEATSTGNDVSWGIKTSTGGINNQHLLKPLQTNICTIATSTCVLRYAAAAGTINLQVLEFNA